LTRAVEIHGGFQVTRQIDVEIATRGRAPEGQVVERARLVQKRATQEVPHAIRTPGDAEGVLYVERLFPEGTDPVPGMRLEVLQLVVRVVADVAGRDAVVAQEVVDRPGVLIGIERGRNPGRVLRADGDVVGELGRLEGAPPRRHEDHAVRGARAVERGRGAVL